MLILILFAVILLIIFTVCLPQILYIILVGFIGYVICKILKRKQMGQMIIILCVFISLDIICEEVMPIINKIYPSKQELQNSVVEIKNNEDNIIEETTENKIWDFLIGFPNEKE